MSNPHGKHPYTGRPNHRYMTVVLEQLGDETGKPDAGKALFDSMMNDAECTALPGYRVTGIGVGDEFSEAEARAEGD